jgi:hypothetical protein
MKTHPPAPQFWSARIVDVKGVSLTSSASEPQRLRGAAGVLGQGGVSCLEGIPASRAVPPSTHAALCWWMVGKDEGLLDSYREIYLGFNPTHSLALARCDSPTA